MLALQPTIPLSQITAAWQLLNPLLLVVSCHDVLMLCVALCVALSILYLYELDKSVALCFKQIKWA